MTENSSLSNICAICIRPLDVNKVTLRCQHEYHAACIIDWDQRNPVCPLCLRNITPDRLQPLCTSFYVDIPPSETTLFVTQASTVEPHHDSCIRSHCVVCLLFVTCMVTLCGAFILVAAWGT